LSPGGHPYETINEYPGVVNIYHVFFLDYWSNIMNANKIHFIVLMTILIIFLAGCGTFEIGIESNSIPEPITRTVEVPLDPTSIPPVNDLTALPPQSDQTEIESALAERLGISIGDFSFAITHLTDEHASGNVSNGYFLASRQEGQWVIVYDGQANPPCRDIDFTGFSSEMVPECLNENGQVIVRTGGDYVRVGEALAEFFGEQPGQSNYSIIQDADSHVLGHAKRGIFLAAKAGEKWLIAFAGNGTPYCAQVDLHNFPPDMVPECMDANNNLIYRTESVSPQISSLQSLDCGPGSVGANPDTAMYVACNVQDGLRSRNTSALLGYMADPFIIGYWLSEGVSESPEIQIQTIQGLYNYQDENYVPRLTFTTDRDLFPELDGRPLEGRFGPDVNVVEVIYSQGWGEGDSEALIFISQDTAGIFKWHSMLIGDLDMPIPGP
jgi:hypothetical protein